VPHRDGGGSVAGVDGLGGCTSDIFYFSGVVSLGILVRSPSGDSVRGAFLVKITMIGYYNNNNNNNNNSIYLNDCPRVVRAAIACHSLLQTLQEGEAHGRRHLTMPKLRTVLRTRRSGSSSNWKQYLPS
jgi:hypothetical protein